MYYYQKANYIIFTTVCSPVSCNVLGYLIIFPVCLFGWIDYQQINCKLYCNGSIAIAFGIRHDVLFNPPLDAFCNLHIIAKCVSELKPKKVKILQKIIYPWLRWKLVYQ